MVYSVRGLPDTDNLQDIPETHFLLFPTQVSCIVMLVFSNFVLLPTHVCHTRMGSRGECTQGWEVGERKGHPGIAALAGHGPIIL